MAEKDFEFYVGGIEDGIIEILTEAMKPLGVKEFATYSGELDSEQLKKAIGALTPRFPLVMVAYSQGEDVQSPVTSKVFGKPIHFRHDCEFLIVCASADARGDKAQRRGSLVGTKKLGCYTMLAKVREVLTGLQLKTSVADEEVLLTYQPLVPVANEFIARLPNITAYAVPFQTYFKWSSADRSVAATEINELVLGVNKNNTTVLPDESPGVKKYKET